MPFILNSLFYLQLVVNTYFLWILPWREGEQSYMLSQQNHLGHNGFVNFNFCILLSSMNVTFQRRPPSLLAQWTTSTALHGVHINCTLHADSHKGQWAYISVGIFWNMYFEREHKLYWDYIHLNHSQEAFIYFLQF